MPPPLAGAAAAQWTPPLAPGASPGSFLDVLNAEILMSPDDASPMQDAALAAMMQQAAPPPVGPQQQQPLQQPSVQGLPLPPMQQAARTQQQQQQQQQQQYGSGSPAGTGGSSLAPASPAKYALIHTAKVVVDSKVMRGPTLMLGVGQVRTPGGPPPLPRHARPPAQPHASAGTPPLLAGVDSAAHRNPGALRCAACRSRRCPSRRRPWCS